MAPKSKILKILTLVIFLWLLIIVLMNVFNDGHSNYYKRIWQDSDHQLNISAKETNNSSWDLAQLQERGSDDDVFIEISYKEPSNDEVMAELEIKLPSIPFAYSRRHENRTMRKSRNCATFPALQTLRYYNNYWQTYSINNITFQLYGAYYDTRADVPQGPVVRILTLINQLKAPFPQSYCHIWYENEEIPDIVPITEYKPIWHWGGSHMFFPHLLTCTPANATAGLQGGRIPQAVALVDHQCDTSTNVLKVVYEEPPASADKLPFGVCVKGLDFPYIDISSRLAEWLEVQRLLGAHKVYMYEIAVHPNVKKVLDYYQNEGFVEVRQITVVGGVVALPHVQHWLLSATRFNKRLNELVPYNDCFYRHMYKYEYIALVDVDEVIMPVGELSTWQDIVQASVAHEESRNCSQGFAGLCFRNTYFPFNTENFTMESSTDDSNSAMAAAPPYMFLLNHPYRTSNYSRPGYATKCLHRTSKAVTLHNHYSLEWMNSCRPFNMPETVGHLQHYHDFPPGQEFNGLLPDYSVQRFREPLIERTKIVLQQLGFLK